MVLLEETETETWWVMLSENEGGNMTDESTIQRKAKDMQSEKNAIEENLSRAFRGEVALPRPCSQTRSMYNVERTHFR